MVIERVSHSALATLLREIGQAIYGLSREQLTVRIKPDGTQVSEADELAHDRLCEGLSRLSPYPVLSEESVLPSWSERQRWETYWLADPLDGTHHFLGGGDQFAINLALIHQHQPVLGMIYAPADDHCYFAERGQGAYEQVGAGQPNPLRCAKAMPEDYQLVVGHRCDLSHFARLHALPSRRVTRLASALKFCTIAAGQADIYPRIGPVSEWDVAAGQCILTEAGGKVLDFKGQVLQYNRQASVICTPFMAACQSIHQPAHWLGLQHEDTHEK